VAVVLGLGLFAVPAAGQTAGQLAQETYAPAPVRALRGGLALPGGGADAPDGADQLFVTLSGLIVEGGMEALASETAAIEKRLKGKRASAADLFAAAADLEAAYAQAGYILARVSLPPQTIADDMPLRLQVTQGYVAGVDASAFVGSARQRVEAVLAPLIGRSALTRGELERRLLLAGDTPGLMLRSTLKAGDAPGAAIIVVDGRYDPISATLAGDNAVSAELGRVSMQAGVDFNNVLGLGESVYLRLAGYPGLGRHGVVDADPRNRQLVAGLSLPLGVDGWSINLEGTRSQTHPESALGYAMLGDYQRWSGRVSYSWLRTRGLNLSTQLGLDIVDESQDIAIGASHIAFSKDSLRILRLTQSADGVTPWGGLVSGTATLSFGLDALGARRGTLALPMSRQGAMPDFAKLDLSGRHSESFADEGLTLTVAGRVQTSFGAALPSSEQIGIGGIGWLSAYGGGDLRGDAGLVLRTDLGFPLKLPALENLPSVGSVVTPYVFAAAGAVSRENPTALEAKTVQAAAFGAGLTLGFAEKASPRSGSLTLEYGHGWSSDLQPSDGLNLRFALRF
jgi:hemolysin activation/secretion protein